MNIIIGRGNSRNVYRLPAGPRLAQADAAGGQERADYVATHANICNMLGINAEGFNRHYRVDEVTSRHKPRGPARYRKV